MTDDINEPEPEEQEPIEAEIVPNEQKEQPVSTRMPSVLSTLPPELLEELNTRLSSGEKVKAVREDMIKKYPAVEPLKVGYQTWLNHFKKLHGGKPKEVEDGTVAKKEMVSSLPTSEEIQKAVSKVIDPSIALEDKQAILAALYAKEMQRLELLEAKQKNYIDKDIELLMLGYVKEVRALLETVSKLQEVLHKDLAQQFRGEIDELIRVILSTVYAAYKLTHEDSDPTNRFDSFRISLEGHLTKTLAAYKSTSQQKPA